MTVNNTNLHKAKQAKNDEFYTRMEDIAKELSNYKKHFKDKVIFCNCDDPEWSNFWIFLHQNFSDYGLKKLIATHYNADGSSSYVMEYTGGNDLDPKDWHQKQLQGNGDFSSDECIELLKEADIIATNPPFSIAREKFIPLLYEYNKKFIIVGDINWITYKRIFPLFKENKIWLGYNYLKEFIQPDGTTAKFGNKLWLTNLDIPKRHESLLSTLTKEYANHPELYLKYDNYDAINVDKVKDIPYDYDGVMGVPITFLDKYNPEEFDIVSFRKGEDGKDLVFTREREREFNRTFESLSENDKVATANVYGWKEEVLQDIDKKKIEPIDLFYPSSMAINGCMNNPKDTAVDGVKKYARILIKRKIV